MVGSLYDQGDRRRDAGFTIFYMGINLGSLFSQILCPLLAGMGSWGGLGWWAGFGLAAAACWCLDLIQFDGGKLDGVGERPDRAPANRDCHLHRRDARDSGGLVPVQQPDEQRPAAEGHGHRRLHRQRCRSWARSCSAPSSSRFPGILIWSYAKGTKAEFQMMIAAMVLITFNVVFWTLFEQAGSSLTLFADRNTDRSVFGLFSISAGQTQFFNADLHRPAGAAVLDPVERLARAGSSRRSRSSSASR
jgi:POT family proton-dependent oligopeptide transporter